MLICVQRVSNTEFNTVVGANAASMFELTVLPDFGNSTLIATGTVFNIGISTGADLTVQTATAPDTVHSVGISTGADLTVQTAVAPDTVHTMTLTISKDV
jgi:hypothetical protein